MKLTIQKFQELYEISKVEVDEIQKSIMLVKALTGKTDIELEEMPVVKYNQLCKEVKDAFDSMNDNMLKGKPQRMIKANGKRYFLNYDIAVPPMSAGRYVELATFSEDVIGNLHMIMATMAVPARFVGYGWRPVKNYKCDNHEQVANDMLFTEFKYAYHACVFFYAVFIKSIKTSLNYFNSLNPRQTEEVKVLLQNLERVSGGFIQANWYLNLKV